MKPLFFAALLLAACSTGPPEEAPASVAPPSILLVTLDTTRADALGYESGGARTPTLDALAGRGVRFQQAYSTVPTTLPAHVSMMTGLYPSDHGIHENARYLGADQELLAVRLRERGYATAAFVSGFPLAAQFGLARGFDHYDDELGAGRAERGAGETTGRALAYLERRSGKPLFLWVHYFDPHDPYEPPEPFRSEHADPYLGEIAYMDRELGRLLEAFETRGDVRILVAGDHGEGRGDHGEALHGNLLYQEVMRVPLIVAGRGVAPGVRSEPVSIRRIFGQVLAWAGEEAPGGLLDRPPLRGAQETVLAEAMKPFLQYGWQPQVMAVRERQKVIRSGDVEIYDLEADPAETRNLAGLVQVDPELRAAIQAYPLPKADSGEVADALSREDRERLASLGYLDWEGAPARREDAPSPRDMTHLFADLDLGSRLFVQERYDRAARVFEGVLEQDPKNLMVAVRLAAAHSILGHDQQALDYFERARTIDPTSVDVRHYQAMHYFRTGKWADAEALLASVLARMPNRLPALEALSRIRETQGRTLEAIGLLERVADLKPAAGPLARLGELRMGLGDTPGAIAAFERAREITDDEFTHDLELGVLYLADRRLPEAAECLDRVPPDHPGYPMALFKRAQVSVLLAEADRAERIRRALEGADATTRRLIENESLFQGVATR